MKQRLMVFLFCVIFFVSGNSFATKLNSLPQLQIIVLLSSAAQKKLSKYNEEITISTNWYGFPLLQKEMLADESGQIKLSASTFNIPLEERVISLNPSKLETQRLTWLKDGVYVNVNIYSARKHWPDNILACDFVDGRLVEVARNPVILRCSLITEHQHSKVVENSDQH